LLTEDNRLVGLVFAGSNTLAACNKIEQIASLLELDIPIAPVIAAVPLFLGLTMLPNLYFWLRERKII